MRRTLSCLIEKALGRQHITHLPVPMRKAIAPKAPWVEGMEIAQATVMPGWETQLRCNQRAQSLTAAADAVNGDAVSSQCSPRWPDCFVLPRGSGGMGRAWRSRTM